METGEGPFWPYWKIYLEPDKTVEKIAGWFIVPYSLEETVEWYAIELRKQGWVETERTYTQPTWAILRYRHPGTDSDIETHVEISIRRNRYLNRTQPMIRRVTIHPWSPAEEETSEMEAEQEAIDDESMVAEHGLSEGAEEVLEKVAVAVSS